MSIHIGARKGQVASRVLLPGDPRRARWIAGKFLESAVQYNTVRNMDGYTGWTPTGQVVSVQGSGIGMPSVNIYVTELIKDHGVKRIIRVGTCGGMQADMKIGDVILAAGSCSESRNNQIRFHGLDFAPIADWDLLYKAYEAAQKLSIPVRVGNILAADRFYGDDPNGWKLWANYGVLAVEMETAELYTLAAQNRIQALTILTVSDLLTTHEQASAEDRERTFGDMVRIALELV